MGKYKGTKSNSYDFTDYIFYNKLTNKTFNGHRFNFCKKYNLSKGNVCWLIKGKNKSVKGWRLIKK
jgi:hypothetical protein